MPSSLLKHTGFIDINQSLDIVVELFANPKYLKEYQDNFLRKELRSGKEGAEGTVSMMYYQFGKGEMELEETILKNQLPHSFEAIYRHEHMDNTMKCRFIELGEKETRYEFEYEYIRIEWIMPRLMSILAPGMYRKPAEKWLQQFKAFAERQ